MKYTRVLHMRAPLMVSHVLNGRPVSPTFVSDRANQFGGATVLVTGDPDNNKLVEVQVAFCNKTDNFCRKTGRDMAGKKEKDVVALRDLPHELADIEDQMLCQLSPSLRKNSKLRYRLTSEWDFVVRYFLPKTPKEEQANG